VSAFEWLGWLGNGCFFGRFLLQWLHVERQRERAAPGVFWVLSLLGSLLLGVYAVERGVWVLLVGFSLNGLIYLRNLRLGAHDAGASLPRGHALALAAASVVALAAAGVASAPLDGSRAWGWLVVAVVGQAVWSSRFVVQWWHSEQSGESHFPPAFWVLSLAGNVLLLAYAVHLRDPVLIAGLALGPLVQLRNLFLTAEDSLDRAPRPYA